ncbi:DUF1415 domain-containing protein [Chitinimonas sp. BJYL2]|uniref:DUF1415 domain-containing protein n=1 Tax=Chitinimonas sp. BJYL2 TaxID=2976696 RepID=UPI0022B4D3A9|nr:DUF1415 domain-containing protein [Chitinimonas sp. BJYL2]
MIDKESVIADTRDWLEKAVIGLNLCPFARAVYVKEQVRYVVSTAPHLDGLLEELDRELQLLAATPAAEIDTTLLIHPALLTDFAEYNDFLAWAEGAVVDNGLEGCLQVASFHPHYQFADTEPDDITNYTNRAPYPTLHLLREDSIDRAVAAFPDAAAIFERNMETLQKLGHEGWRKLGLKATPKA